MKSLVLLLLSRLRAWFSTPLSQSSAEREDGFEALEPRILYSAAPVEAPAPAQAEASQPAESTAPAAQAPAAAPASAESAQAPAPEPVGATAIAAEQTVTLVDVASEEGVAPVDAETVRAVAEEAAQRWRDSGISAEQSAALDAINYSVGNLGGNLLGHTNGFNVTIDDNAAGAGWFVDATASLDEEFSASGNALAGTDAAGRVDLLSVILHEQGHILGLDGHEDDIVSGDVMNGAFNEGERRLPVEGQADGAVAGSLTGNHYALLTNSTTIIADDFTTTSVSTTTDGFRLREYSIDNGWQAARQGGGSGWTVTGGTLQNASTVNTPGYPNYIPGESPVAQAVSTASLGIDDSETHLVFSFDYSVAAGDTLYVTLWGHTGTFNPASSNIFSNLEVRHGLNNLEGSTTLDAFNLLDGATSGFGGTTNPLAVLAGGTSGTFSTSIDVSSLGIAGVAKVNDLSVLTLGFGKVEDGAAGTTSIANLSLESVEVVAANADTYQVDNTGTTNIPASSGVLSNDQFITTANLTLNYDANDPASAVGSNWRGGVALNDWNFGGDVTLQDVTGGNNTRAGITNAYRFTNGPGAENRGLNDLLGDPSDNSATWEFWLRPDDRGDGNQIIFETGGAGDGMAIWYARGTNNDGNGSIRFTIDDGSVRKTISANINRNDFHQVAAVYEQNAGGKDLMQLYIDGVLIDDNDSTTTLGAEDGADTDTDGLNDWDGGDTSGLGNAGNSLGETISNGEFDGDISVFRFYEAALTQAEIDNNFNAVATPNTVTEINGVAAGVGAAVALTNGSVTVNADGSFSYTPTAAGNDSFTYTASDGVNTTTAAVTLNQIANTAPTANDDPGATTNESTAIIIDVLGNDVDPDAGQSRIVTVPATSANGVPLEVLADGQVRYDPLVALNGLVGTNLVDTFTYTLSDGIASDTATVTVTVSPESDTAVAGNDTATTDEATVVSGNVLLNDSDVDSITAGADLNFDASADLDGAQWENTGHTAQTWVLNSNAGVAPVLTAVTSGHAGITQAYQMTGGATGGNNAFKLQDGNGADRSVGNLTNDATDESASFEIWFKPDSLPNTGQRQILFEDGGGTGIGLFIEGNNLVAKKLPGNASDRLAVDISGLAGDFIQAVLTFNRATAPDQMELFVNGTSAGTFGADNGGDFSGGDPLAVGGRGGANVGGQGGGDSNSVSFQGQVAAFRFYRNQILDLAEVNQNYRAVNQGHIIRVSEVNGQAADVGNEVTLASGAKVTLNANGTFDYDPNGSFEDLAAFQSATDTFDYTVSDGVDSTTATVTVTINGLNDLPTANNDPTAATTDEDNPVTVTNPGVTGNDTDADTTVQILSADTTSAAGATVTVNGQTDIGEVGQVTVGGTPITVNFQQTYVNPVIIALPSQTAVAADTGNDPDAATVRIDNIDLLAGTFDLRLQAPAAGSPGFPMMETVNYIVIEAGTYQLANGAILEAGTQVVADGADSNITFTGPFTTTPVALSQVMSENAAGYVQTRHRAGVSDTGVTLFLEEAEGAAAHGTSETVGYIAIDQSFGTIGGLLYEAGVTPNNVTQNAVAVPFVNTYTSAPLFVGQQQTIDGADPSGIRFRYNGNGVDVETDEDGNAQSETAHADEVVGFFAFEATSGFLQGVAVGGTTGGFTYDPNGQFESLALGQSTTDTFDYTITDGAGTTDTATATVTVNGANDDPSITSSATANVQENDTFVLTVTEFDVDTIDTHTFSLSGGADQALFDIDMNTGALSFITAPDFENPTDLGGVAGDNIYQVQVRATDNNGGFGDLLMNVTVTDLAPTTFIQNFLNGGDSLTAYRNGGLIEIYRGPQATGTQIDQRQLNDISAVVFNGGDGADTAIFDYSNGDLVVPLEFHGNDPTIGTGDDLLITGGSFTNVVHNASSGSDGTIDIDGTVAEITYTGLEPVIMDSGIANLTINLTGGFNDVAILEDNGVAGDGLSRLRTTSGTAEVFTFSNPTGSLTINLGDGNDSLTVDPSFDNGGGAGQFNVPLTIDGQAGEDVINLDAALDLPGGSLDVTSENINLNNDITATAVTLDGVNRVGTSLTIDTSAANGDITFDGTVIATGAGGQDLTLNAGTGGNVNFNDAVTRGATAESGGVIVVEAEHYTGREARTAGGQTNWELVPNESAGTPAQFLNFRGDGYVQALPNGGGTDGANSTPEIRYEVEITTAGTYRLFPRWTGHDGGSDSMFMDIVELKDGVGGTIADHYEYAGGGFNNSNFASPSWSTDGGFETNNATAIPRVQTTWDLTPGTYTVRATVREDASALDAFVLQLDTLASPSGTGPAESARGPRLGTVQIVNADDVTAATFFDAQGFHQIDGQGTTTFGGDVTIGDSGFIVQEGDVDVNGDLEVTGDTRIGLVDATGGGDASVTVVGGNVSLGDGDDVLDVGRRETSPGTHGILDLGQATGVDIDVTDIRMGTRLTQGGSNLEPEGDIFLSVLGTNNVMANTIQMGETQGAGGFNTAVTNNLILGDADNNFNVDTWSIGGPKSNGDVRFANLNGGSGAVPTTIGSTTPGFNQNPEPDGQTLTSINRGAFNFTSITGATLDTTSGSLGTLFGAQNDGIPANTNAALSGLVITDGQTNVQQSNYTLGTTVNDGDAVGFFLGEISIPGGQAGDDLTVIPLDAGGNPISTWSLSITGSDYGPQGPQQDATVANIHTRLTSFTLNDFTGGAGTLTGVAGLRLQDNVGGVTFDPNVVGTFTGAPFTAVPGNPVLNLSGKTGAETDLFVGDNNIATGANGVGTLDLSGGTFNGTLDEVILGRHPGLTGSADGTLVMDDGTVTADTVIFAQDGGSNPQNSSGVLTQRGGTFTVANGVSDGGGVSTLNIQGGDFNVTAGNVTLDNLNVDDGTFDVDAGGLTVDNMRVGYNGGQATATVSGGAVVVGDGDGTFDIGRRTSGNGFTKGTVDFGSADSVTIDVNNVRMGTDTAGNGGSEGDLTLSQAGANTVTATTFQMSATPSGDNQVRISELHLGGDANNFNVDNLTVGDLKGVGRVDIAAGGTLTLAGDANPETDLRIGYNFTATGTNPLESQLDLTGGTFNATLDQVFIGRHNTSSGSGKGSLSFDMGTVTANGITVAEDVVGTNPANTQGTINFGGDVLDLQGGDILTNRGAPLFVFTDGLLTDVNVFDFDLHQMGGILQIGDGNAVDTMTVNGDFETDAGSTLEVNLDGPAGPGVTGGHDQLIVNGSVTLNNSDLNLILGGTFTAPAAGTEIVLIDNDGADAVTGEFNGLPEGFIITLAIPNPGTPPPALVPGQLFEVSYVGGDGNDVVLRTLAETATTNIWIDAAGNLKITDIDGANSTDNLTIRVEGTEVVITDPDNALGTLINGAEQTSVNEVRVDVSLFTGDVMTETLDGDDVINIGDLGASILPGGFTVDGGDGFDQITYTGDGSVLAAGGSASFTGEEITFLLGDLTTTDGDIIATGTGGTGSGSNHQGVHLLGSDLTAGGTGAITLTGEGGDTGLINNQGVFLTNDSQVTTNDGAVTIVGTGGGTIGGHGVSIVHGSDITAGGSGSLSITGTSTTTGTFNNQGIEISYGTDLTAGTGITIAGTGAGTGISRGVSAVSVDLLVTGTGNISVTGTSTATGSNNQGLLLTNTTMTTADGSVTLMGTGSATGLSNNEGIRLSNVDIATGGNGAIAITGVGGGTGINGTGVALLAGSTVAADGGGTVTIDGTGASGTSLNRGVYISGIGSSVTSGSGAITILGTGNGSLSMNRGIETTYANIMTGGNVTMTGTGSMTSSGAFNTGIYMLGGSVTSGGTLGFTGNGGTGSSYNEGVRVVSGSLSATGALNLLGTSNTTGFGVANSGVYIIGLSSLTGGGGSITGVGGSTSGLYNHGIYMPSTVMTNLATAGTAGGGNALYNKATAGTFF